MKSKLPVYRFPSNAPREEYLDLIRRGKGFRQAADILGISQVLLAMMIAQDQSLREDITKAEKDRGDHWVESIIRTVDVDCDPKDVPNEKLKFEKYKYLAEIDNPEKYGKTSTSEVNVNVFDIKGITDAQALTAIRNDPFAIDVEAEVIEEGVEDGTTEGITKQEEESDGSDYL
jgi:hypothetical protein